MRKDVEDDADDDDDVIGRTKGRKEKLRMLPWMNSILTLFYLALTSSLYSALIIMEVW